MAEQLWNGAIAGSIPGRAKITLCPWAKHFTLLDSGRISPLLKVSLDKSVC